MSEYLLKPVSVQDLHSVLQKVASELEQESRERRALQKLRDQVEENRAALRERFLLKLVTGAASPADAIEKSQLLGIDLVARCYLVVVVRVEPADSAEPFDYYGACQRAQQVLSGVVGENPDVFLLRMDMQKLVLLPKGNWMEYLIEERDLLIERIRAELEPAGCRLTVGSGPLRSGLLTSATPSSRPWTTSERRRMGARRNASATSSTRPNSSRWTDRRSRII